MNEQIKALMGQTLDEKFAGTWSTMDMQDLQKFAERFAELIVRDCMEVASPNYMSTPEDSVYYVEQAIDRIAEHFGVEE